MTRPAYADRDDLVVATKRLISVQLNVVTPRRCRMTTSGGHGGGRPEKLGRAAWFSRFGGRAFNATIGAAGVDGGQSLVEGGPRREAYRQKHRNPGWSQGQTSLARSAERLRLMPSFRAPRDYPVLLRIERIARTSHGSDAIRLAAFTQGPADPAHMHVNCACNHMNVLPPHGRQ